MSSSSPSAPPCPDRPRSLARRALRFCFFRPKRPVSWLAPGQLLTTGLQVGLADRLGAYLDKRELQELFPQETLDESAGRDELWVDYVADTGDGFNATYAIAYLLGKRELGVKGHSFLPRGQVLMMGGDQVYPTPSPEAYDDRLRGPFRAALPGVAPNEPRPTVYALPGNHDWYDGLTAFFRVFAGSTTTIGAWRTRQQRSYFAMKLPQGWWLFALDAQSGAHIDDPQLEYFRTIISTKLDHGDRIILCTPRPAWVQGQRDDDAYTAIDYFMRKVISTEGQTEWLREKKTVPEAGTLPKRISVPLMVSGDWHHYSRYESSDGGTERRQLITSGSGGAYLYGTHRLPQSIVVPPPIMRPPKSQTTNQYGLKKRYPSFLRSLWLGLGAPVRLPLRNFTFVLLLGILQGFMLFALQRAEGLGVTVGLAIMSLVFFFLALFFSAGLVVGKRRWIRILTLTVLHTYAQIAVGRLVLSQWRDYPLIDVGAVWKRPASGMESDLWGATDYVARVLHDTSEYVVHGFVAGILSAIVVGIYLVVASMLGLNFNELFSSQRIEGYKGFLRMHIARDGSLTIYVIGVRRVRRPGPGFVRWHWRATPNAADPSAPWFEPRRRLRPTLVEKITIP